MGFVVTRPSAEEAPAISDIHLRAMDANLLTRAQYPGPAWEYFRSWLTRNTLQHHSDADKGVLVARDADVGDVASFIKWLAHPPGGNEASAKNLEPFSSKDCNLGLLQSYAELTENARRQTMGPKPYYRRRVRATGVEDEQEIPDTTPSTRLADVALLDVTFLCTDPRWGGRGAAKALLRRLQELAAADGMAIVLEATVQGMPLPEAGLPDRAPS